MITTIEHLEGIFDNLSNLQCDPSAVNTAVLGKLTATVEHENDPAVQFRASQIGRPWITQILDKWYGQGKSFNIESAQTMYEGRVTQAWAEVILDLVPTMRYVTEGLVSHSVIQGHYDILITTPDGKRTVLEVKSMGGHLLKDFRANPHDNYGYLSQLSFYANTLQADYAAFLVKDRTTSKWCVIEPTEHALAHRWERLTRVVEQVKVIQPYNVDQLLDTIYESGIPHPVSGKLPPNMRWSKWVETLYQLRDGCYSVRPRGEVATILKQIPASRRDGVQLSLEFG